MKYWGLCEVCRSEAVAILFNKEFVEIAWKLKDDIKQMGNLVQLTKMIGKNRTNEYNQSQWSRNDKDAFKDAKEKAGEVRESIMDMLWEKLWQSKIASEFLQQLGEIEDRQKSAMDTLMKAFKNGNAPEDLEEHAPYLLLLSGLGIGDEGKLAKCFNQSDDRAWQAFGIILCQICGVLKAFAMGCVAGCWLALSAFGGPHCLAIAAALNDIMHAYSACVTLY